MKLIWKVYKSGEVYFTNEGVMVSAPWDISYRALVDKLGAGKENKGEHDLLTLFPLTPMQQCVENAKEYGRTPDFKFSFDENLIEWRNIARDKSNSAPEVWIPESYGTEDFSIKIPSIYKMGFLGGEWDESWNDMLAEMWAYRYAHDLIYASHRGSDSKGFGG